MSGCDGCEAHAVRRSDLEEVSVLLASHHFPQVTVLRIIPGVEFVSTVTARRIIISVAGLGCATALFAVDAQRHWLARLLIHFIDAENQSGSDDD